MSDLDSQRVQEVYEAVIACVLEMFLINIQNHKSSSFRPSPLRVVAFLGIYYNALTFISRVPPHFYLRLITRAKRPFSKKPYKLTEIPEKSTQLVERDGDP